MPGMQTVKSAMALHVESYYETYIHHIFNGGGGGGGGGG